MVLALKERVEVDPAPVSHDPVAELDILDARHSEFFVKSADVLELRRPQRTAARPECPGAARVAHVRVVVQEVAILAHEARCGGRVVVGTEQCREPVVADECRMNAVDRIGSQLHVGVHEEQNSAAGLVGRLVSRRGRPAAALERAVACAPQMIDAWLALADLEAIDDNRRAIDILERAVEAVPEGSRPLVRAEMERRSGNETAAAAAFRTLLESSADPFVMRRAAECFAQAGRPGEARAALERLVANRPSSEPERAMSRWARRRLAEDDLRGGPFPVAERALQLLGLNSAKWGKYASENAVFAATLLAQRPEPRSWRQALELLETLSQQQPLPVPQQVLIAQLRDRLGDWRRARVDLLKLAVKPDMPDVVYEALVELLIAHEDRWAAKSWIHELVSRAPTTPKTIELEARLAQLQDDRPAAVAAAKRLMPAGEVTAADVPAVVATAATMERLGFIAAANNLLEQAAAASAAGVSARIPFLIRQGQPTAAAELLDSSSELLASHPDLPWLEALVLESMGRNDDAERRYRQIVEGAGFVTAVRVQAAARLVFLLLDRKSFKEAITMADRATLELGDHPDLLDARGVAGIAIGNIQGAMADLTEAVLTPTPTRLLHVAHAKTMADDYGKARELLRRALTSGLDPAKLRATDREHLELLAKKLGVAINVPPKKS